MTLRLFTDGSTFGKNPSNVGGGWAWCLVDTSDNDVIAEGSGVVRKWDWQLPAITNNITELVGAVRGLEHVERTYDERFEWWTDSNVTRCRFVNKNAKWNGVPVRSGLASLVSYLRKNLEVRAVLCAGHATRKEIASGRRQRNGLPTSVWNTYVDEMCKKVMWKEFGV